MRRAWRTAAVVLAALATGTVGCADSESGDAPGGSVVSNAGEQTGTAYNSVAELARTLGEHGLPCTLQYPGLRDDMTQAELSICTIDGDQGYLRVWNRPEAIQLFLRSPENQSGTVAVGANWTVSLTTPATAQRVAVALGGFVPTASTTTTTSTAAP